MELKEKRRVWMRVIQFSGISMVYPLALYLLIQNTGVGANRGEDIIIIVMGILLLFGFIFIPEDYIRNLELNDEY